jgi:hypothetical protein
VRSAFALYLHGAPGPAQRIEGQARRRRALHADGPFAFTGDHPTANCSPRAGARISPATSSLAGRHALAMPRSPRRHSARPCTARVCTSVKAQLLDSSSIVSAYKSLSNVERAFRSLKTVDLEIRPIHHRRGHRVRAHVLLCMLAYYLEWHMRQRLKPILFDDHDKPAADAARSSIVAKATRSHAAQRKAATQRIDDDLPVHSFQSLIADLATFTRNTMAMGESPDTIFLLYPELTRIRNRYCTTVDSAIPGLTLAKLQRKLHTSRSRNN